MEKGTAISVAITYQSGAKRSALRTVIVDDVRSSVVLLPQGSMQILTAKLLHGSACRHSWWAQQLGTDPDSDDFAVPAELVVAQRQIQIAVRAHHKKG